MPKKRDERFELRQRLIVQGMPLDKIEARLDEILSKEAASRTAQASAKSRWAKSLRPDPVVPSECLVGTCRHCQARPGQLCASTCPNMQLKPVAG